MVSTASVATYDGVRQAIYNAASATGVDFNYLLNQARAESRLNPDAKAPTSSATGLYQFIEQSWLGMIARHGNAHGLGWAASAIGRGPDGRYRVADRARRDEILDLRRNPGASAAMAAEFASDNRDMLEARLGHRVEPVDLYLAHFLGAGGATRFLREYETTPDAAAAEMFPAAARTNRNVFFKSDGAPRSLSEIRARFAAKFAAGSEPASDAGSVDAPITRTVFRHMQDDRPVKAASTNQARLAYLMLAALGVSA